MTKQIKAFSKDREIVIDSLRVSNHKHIIHALLDVDVTLARQRIRSYQEQKGKKLSFTAFILFCLGKAVSEHKITHAYRDWRRQLVLFDQVDVTTIIEVQRKNQTFPLAHIMRSTNERTVLDMTQEIRRIQADPGQSPSGQKWHLIGLYNWVPAFLRTLLLRGMLRFPEWVKQNIGTVGVTAVGMFGQGSGWGIPMPIYTLNLTLGGISEKPGVSAGQIAIREYLDLTISVDHDIVDGAPLARFANSLRTKIVNGEGLQ